VWSVYLLFCFFFSISTNINTNHTLLLGISSNTTATTMASQSSCLFRRMPHAAHRSDIPPKKKKKSISLFASLSHEGEKVRTEKRRKEKKICLPRSPTKWRRQEQKRKKKKGEERLPSKRPNLPISTPPTPSSEAYTPAKPSPSPSLDLPLPPDVHVLQVRRPSSLPRGTVLHPLLQHQTNIYIYLGLPRSPTSLK
jgi:hypothetical protein